MKNAVTCAVFLSCCLPLAASAAARERTAIVTHLAVVKGRNSLSVEITTSRPVTPQTQMATQPDRLVIDFPGTLPGEDLHQLLVNLGNLKGVRAGLHSANPPVTRVVLDLAAAQPYQLSRSGSAIVVRLAAGESPSTTADVLSPAVQAKPVQETRWTVVRRITDWPPERLSDIQSNSAATLRQVTVLEGTSFELEILGDRELLPRTQTVENPNRLVVDFPGTVPGPALHDLRLNRTDVRGVRVGLLSARPPVTRVVLDLNARPQFELFPAGNRVIVKLAGNGLAPDSRPAPSLAALEPLPIPAPASPALEVSPQLRVSVQGGKLSVWANGASLSEVLYEVHRQTGADIPIPSQAETEKVVTDLGPGPARDVIADLLNGSPFDFVIVGSQNDPTRVSSVQLTLRDGKGIDPPADLVPPPPADETPQVVPQPEAVPEPQPDVQPAPQAPAQQIPPQQAPTQ